MAMIMTIEDDDDDVEDIESDDGDFAMDSSTVGAGLAQEPKSLGWQMTEAHKGLRPSAPGGASLDAKLKQRAKPLVAQQPPPRPEDAATELSESRTGKVAREKRARLHKEETPSASEVAAGDAADVAEAEAVEAGRRAGRATNFDQLQLSKPLIKAVAELGFSRPTPIQAAVIPHALKGLDLCASAVTGSGKTAAFMLPTLERLLYRPRRIAATRVVVLLPTRELAAQCEAMGKQLSRFSDVRMCLIVGGLSVKVQEADLRSRPDVVLATPGRLIDLVRNAVAVSLDELEILVLDEADRLLELGFKAEVEEVIQLCPRSRQTMFFSATISPEVAALANLSLNKPVQIKVDRTYTTATRLQQEFVRLKPKHEHERTATLLSLVSRTFKERCIVFFASKRGAHRAKLLFGLAGLSAAELHGNLTQTQRLHALEQFRDGKTDFLLATDLAGRGLDIAGVKTVINHDLPTEMKTYVHRVGRTARAGSEGRSVSIVAERDRAFLKQVLKHAQDHTVQTRAVPAESVAYWQERIGEMEGEVEGLLQEEYEDKKLRVAEMEANKASNLLEHRDEIMARPPRSWFQTPREKEEERKAGRSAPTAMELAQPEEPPKPKVKRDKYAGLTRKQRRSRQRDELFAQGEEEGSAVPLPDQKRDARQAKAQARSNPGMAGTKRAMADAAGVPGAKRKAPRKEKPAEAPKERPEERARKGPNKKIRSRSKAKFSKARKR